MAYGNTATSGEALWEASRGQNAILRGQKSKNLPKMAVFDHFFFFWLGGAGGEPLTGGQMPPCPPSHAATDSTATEHNLVDIAWQFTTQFWQNAMQFHFNLHTEDFNSYSYTNFHQCSLLLHKLPTLNYALYSTQLWPLDVCFLYPKQEWVVAWPGVNCNTP